MSGPVRAADGAIERAPCNTCGAEMPLVFDRFGAKVIVRHRVKGERGTTCPGSFKAAADAPAATPETAQRKDRE